MGYSERRLIGLISGGTEIVRAKIRATTPGASRPEFLKIWVVRMSPAIILESGNEVDIGVTPFA
ncbi:hypothetical protein M434DRAFT_31196 [Hypoxylon sp. CO27-5]|nr:hypothetical protein M434DRAFT_31196 [Hypoxylon sp. CO27-5]